MSSSRVVFTVAFICLWLSAFGCVPGPASGRAFLEDKTGIALGEPASVCASGVADSEDCRPSDYGSGEWHKQGNFPPYSVSQRAASEDEDYKVQTVIAEVRAHYLGSPYYDGDVHAFCKAGVPNDAYPPEGTSLQDYDLAKIIEDRAVKDLGKQLKAALDAKDVADSGDITARFQHNLTNEVRARVKAHLLWFVARYPGGRPDMSRNEKLKACVEEQRVNSAATLVTGVAGYIVLNNQIDTAVSGESTMVAALDSALAAHAGLALEPEVRADLALRWKTDVDHVAQIKTARQDLSTVAWPLWVQFQ
jgi:hypothetical protein